MHAGPELGLDISGRLRSPRAQQPALHTFWIPHHSQRSVQMEGWRYNGHIMTMYGGREKNNPCNDDDVFTAFCI